MLAKDIMRTEVLCVSANAKVREALEIMVKKSISGLPVLNERGNLVGIISESDIIHREVLFDKFEHWILLESFLHRSKASKSLDDHNYSDDLDYYLEHKVEDVMTVKIISALPDTPVEDIAKLMVERKVNRIPIVKGEKVVGIITRGDILQALKHFSTYTK